MYLQFQNDLFVIVFDPWILFANTLCFILAEAKHELLEVQMEMDRQTDNSNVQQERLDRATEENVRLKKSKKQLEDDLEEIRERLTDSMLGTSQLTAEVRRGETRREKGRDMIIIIITILFIGNNV